MELLRRLYQGCAGKIYIRRGVQARGVGEGKAATRGTIGGESVYPTCISVPAAAGPLIFTVSPT